MMKRRTAKQKAAIKKARKTWMGMSKKARKKAMPERPYPTRTKKWHDLVRKLKRKRGIRTPEALATWILGKRSYLKRRKRSRR